MLKYGFVYIWFDIKHKRFYIGSHWGTEDDGYICSSKWMKDSYKRRPNDFKRKILSKVFTNKKDLLEEEYKWLKLIKQEELGKRYYNLHNHHFNHWSTNKNEYERIKKLAKERVVSEETRRKQSLAKIGKMDGEKNPMYGKPGTKGHLGHTHSEDIRTKISEKVQEAYDSGKLIPWNKGKTGGTSWNKGKKLSEEHKKKLREAKLGKPSNRINKQKEVC